MNNYYNYNYNCAHCVWNSQNYPQDTHIPNVGKPCWVVEPTSIHEGGVSVYKTDKKFFHSWNVVYGTKNHPVHDIENMGSLLRGCVKFIDHMQSKGFINLRLLVNRPYKKKYGKEHLHSLITADSNFDRNLYEQKLTRTELRFTQTNKKMQQVSDCPYGGDKIIDLEPDMCLDIILSKGEDLIKDLINQDLTRQKLPILKDLKTLSYFLFIKFGFEDKQTTIKGGKLSYVIGQV